MEKYTPLDLERAQLPRAFRGYDTEAVDNILATASRQLETQLIEIRRLHRDLREAESALEPYRLQETALRDALVLAQKTGEETRALANKEAELIREAARQEANEIKRESQAEVRALQEDLDRLTEQKRSFTEKYRTLLRENLASLEGPPPTQAVFEVAEIEAATG